MYKKRQRLGTRPPVETVITGHPTRPCPKKGTFPLLINPCPFPLDVSRSSRFLHYYFRPHVSLSLPSLFLPFSPTTLDLSLPHALRLARSGPCIGLSTPSPAQTGLLPAAATLTTFPHKHTTSKLYTFTTKRRRVAFATGQDPTTSNSLDPYMSRSSHGCCSQRHLAYSPCPSTPPAYQHRGQPGTQFRFRLTSGSGFGRSFLT